MRSILLATVIGIGIPAHAIAGPVGFATYLFANGAKSQFSSPSDQLSVDSGSVEASASANLSEASLKIYTSGSNGNAGVQALFYDTLTFDGSAFEGVFGSSYTLNLTATYDGTFTGSNIETGGVGGRIHVYSGSTVIDSSVFSSPDSLIDFMFINGPTPLCANGVNGPDLASYSGSFTYSVSCSVTVNAANPSVKLFMNLPGFVNAAAGSWTLNMLNTGTLDLGDLGGRTVFSASGALPGTTAIAPVPEPATLLLTGLGFGAAAIRRRAR